ncbi:DUF2742 domain-containing protein [Gordonia otitidis]|uniref:DUF2742 domain-containing protein n=1 Tax=Gordonia otitidis TaxID=249058 RepID=UPI001D14E404|nr:DUF2742 domain-containing protein [Gordonia otitidis]UEA58581.1 DUF2742 domain-containing protein [Gordonia otitidis]
MNYDEANALRYQLLDVELPEGVDRARYHSLLTCGVLCCLQQGLDAIEERRLALKEAAREVSQAADWAAVAQRVRNRDSAIRSGAYVERVVS